MIESARIGETSLNLRATMALAVGAAVAPFAGANADPIVTQVNADFPQSISFDGSIAFSIDATGAITGVGNNLIAGTNAVPFKLYAGAVVNASLFASGSLSTGTLGPTSKAISTYFIGLEIVGANNQDYFGYAEIGLTTDIFANVPDELIDYAFESDPNTGIAIPTIPEPGSLALLATGVAGALAIRRRARHASA